ncbi:MAG TPA: acyltransferase, partial [Sphingorhabdus lacus]|nr:acyltransferase [Sphingorhabdus lacus]
MSVNSKTTTSALSYRPDIDGLRAIAVLAVLFFHADLGFVPGGYAGVDIFFVISGYLITRLIVGEIDEDNFSLMRFYERRIRRLFPALF